MGGVKETLCTSCVHAQVCSLKQTFLAVQKEVDNISISAEEKNSVFNIVDFRWLNITMNCTHRILKTNTRSGGCSNEQNI